MSISIPSVDDSSVYDITEEKYIHYKYTINADLNNSGQFSLDKPLIIHAGITVRCHNGTKFSGKMQ